MSGLERLTAGVVQWEGTNTLHDPTTGKPEETPTTLTATPILKGRYVRIDYAWSWQGKPQEGSLLIGAEAKSGKIAAYWVDTWHMAFPALVCEGSVSDDGKVSLLGSFAAPPGPDWHWRIELTPEDESLRVVHVCIEPSGEESLAVEAVYRKAGR